MARQDALDEIAAVASICRRLGLGEVTATILKAAHHTTLLISPLMIVARVQSAEPVGAARRRAVRELAVARYLAERGGPAIVPLGRLAGPHVAASAVVTFWPYVAHARTAGDGDAALAAATLASIHDALLAYGGELPPYTGALDRCRAVLADDSAATALSADDRALLAAQYRRLRRDVEANGGRPVPLHGDVHPGNLLLSEHGPLWVDFEDACLGPREYDIAGLPTDAWPLFTDADRALVETCADLKSVCVAVWCSADVSRSTEVREAAAYHLDRVRASAR